MPDEIQKFLDKKGEQKTPDKEIIKEIEADNEKDYLKELKKKNKGYLIDNLSFIEKERIASWVEARIKETKTDHDNRCDEYDRYDEVYRMLREEVPGSDGEMPNYRSPVSTVTLEVLHANIMNQFFLPKEVGRVLPVEESDVKKVGKLSTFLNWSMENEMELFAQIDRLFHSSGKIGECPYLVHWIKEYGTEIEREIVYNPANPGEPLIDPDTQQAVYQEVEKTKLLYSGPSLETFSRKDYYQPKNAIMDKEPEWEARKVRMTYDEYLRDQLQGKLFDGTIEDVFESGGHVISSASGKVDYEGDQIPLGKWEQEFIEFYGRFRINVLKKDVDNAVEDLEEELEDEFICLTHLPSGTLCALRKNKFPLKMRPIGMDYFIADDEGRRRGIGVIEFMDGIQKSYDRLFNQFVYGVIQSNNPIVYFTPFGNMRNEPLKIQNGFQYPTADPNSVKIFQLPAPNDSIRVVLEMINQWAQLLFGISDFTAGIESRIDPSAPARKAQIVVAQGNVRMNAIIKRKVKTMKDIFFRWYLLYRDNMPKNKFIRVTGSDKENPWEFQAINLSDFALKALPDFELTGNVLSADKNLEAQKRLAIYDKFLTNPLFNPQTTQGLRAIYELTRWLADGMDEIGGLSRIIPKGPEENVATPEEENARMIQGETGEPTEGEDHVYHMRIHNELIIDPTIPEPIKQEAVRHNIKHGELMKKEITMQIVMQRGGANVQQTGQPAPGAPAGVVTEQPAGVA